MTTYEQAVLDLAGPVPAIFDTFHAGPNQALVAILQACAGGDFRLGDSVSAALTDQPAHQAPDHGLTAPWIYLTGEPGSGRSHLLLASCQRARSCGRDALYLGLKHPPSHIPPTLPGMDHVALVALDDIDAMAANPAWEEGLFHFLNRARASGAWVLMSAKKGPQEAGFLLPDLRSRLSWGQRHKLKPLDDADLSSVLRIHAQARGLPVDDKLIRYLLNHCERDSSSLLEALNQLQRAAFASKRKPSINLAASLFNPGREERDQAAATVNDESNAVQQSTLNLTLAADSSPLVQDTHAGSELPDAPWADPEYIPPQTRAPQAPAWETAPWEYDVSASDPVPAWEHPPQQEGKDPDQTPSSVQTGRPKP